MEALGYLKTSMYGGCPYMVMHRRVRKSSVPSEGGFAFKARDSTPGLIVKGWSTGCGKTFGFGAVVNMEPLCLVYVVSLLEAFKN